MRRRLLAWQFRLFLRHVAASRRPIVVGPHVRELGFEVLYWLPFVQQARADYGLEKGRLIALSRGGMGRAYEMAGSADVYDYLPVDTVRLHQVRATAAHQTSKQYTVEPWERHVVALAASSLGLARPLMLHPSWMYQLLHGYWTDTMAVKTLSRWLNPTPLPLMPLPEGLRLPDTFVAVRIYARATMQPHDGVVFWLKRHLMRLAERRQLVFLCSDARYDDHADIVRPFGPNMIDLSAYSTPQTNLALQLAVIQRSALFLGTYGGLAQMALRAQKPAIALYTAWGGTAYAHVDLTHRLALSTQTPFYLVMPQQLEAMEELWG
jgi:hypothetical protein